MATNGGVGGGGKSGSKTKLKKTMARDKKLGASGREGGKQAGKFTAAERARIPKSTGAMTRRLNQFSAQTASVRRSTAQYRRAR